MGRFLIKQTGHYIQAMSEGDDGARVSIVFERDRVTNSDIITKARIAELYKGNLKSGNIRGVMCMLLKKSINSGVISPGDYIQLEASGHVLIDRKKSFVALLNMYTRMSFTPVYAKRHDDTEFPIEALKFHMSNKTEFEMDNRPLYVVMVTKVGDLLNWCQAGFF